VPSRESFPHGASYGYSKFLGRRVQDSLAFSMRCTCRLFGQVEALFARHCRNRAIDPRAAASRPALAPRSSGPGSDMPGLILPTHPVLPRTVEGVRIFNVLPLLRGNALRVGGRRRSWLRLPTDRGRGHRSTRPPWILESGLGRRRSEPRTGCGETRIGAEARPTARDHLGKLLELLMRCMIKELPAGTGSAGRAGSSSGSAGCLGADDAVGSAV
jgi:hypothetical protein